MRLTGIIILTAILSGCRPTPSLHGTYSSGPNFAGVVYTFNSDSTFTLDGWSCTSADTGSGKYKLTRDSLILVFDSIPSSYHRPVVFDSLGTGGDSCSINIFCNDEIEPMPFAIITCETASGKKLLRSTDIDGKAQLKVDRNDFPLSVKCTYAGFQSVLAKIDSPGDFTLTFSLTSNFTYRIPAGTRFAYGIEKITNDGFILNIEYEDVEGKTRTQTELYKRKW